MIGSAPDRLLHPGDLAVAPDGTLVVQDGGNSRIQRFSRDGKFINGFSTTRYEGFAVSPNNEIYLGQPENGALISVYSSTGKLLRSFGKLKEHSDLFGPESEPQNDAYRIASNRIGMTVDRAGNIFVAFRAAGLIQQYKPDGSLVSEHWLQGEQVDRLLELSTRHKYFTTGTDGVESRLLTFDITIEPNSGNLLLFMVDGSIHTVDHSGKILFTLKATTEENLRPFTPHTAGIGAKGEIIVVPFQYKRCFKLVPPSDRVVRGDNGGDTATTDTVRR